MVEGTWSELPDRGVVDVGGVDARRFLHNLVTTNIEALADGAAGYGALLSPQGKVQFDFVVQAAGDRFLFDIAATLAADFARRLSFYRLRAPVTIADASATHRVAAAWGGGTPDWPGAIALAPDPRLPALGFRAILPRDSAARPAGWRQADPGAFDAHRIALGVPAGGIDFAYGEAFPHEAGLDQLGGIDFAKGCYTGQEVVSRMEHRGTARRRIIVVRGAGDLPPAGTEVMAGATALGTIGSTSGATGLASIRLDRAREAVLGGVPITAAGAPVQLEIPGWARFGWPDPAAA